MFCIVNNVVVCNTTLYCHSYYCSLDNIIVDNTEHNIVILSYCQYSYDIAHIVLYCQQYCKGLVCRCSRAVSGGTRIKISAAASSAAQDWHCRYAAVISGK
jgi:hypothetical protein